jgi:hypothetical protein
MFFTFSTPFIPVKKYVLLMIVMYTGFPNGAKTNCSVLHVAAVGYGRAFSRSIHGMYLLPLQDGRAALDQEEVDEHSEHDQSEAKCDIHDLRTQSVVSLHSFIIFA